MDDFTEFLRREIILNGASKVGFADLHEIDEKDRYNLKYGISFCIELPEEIVEVIKNKPTIEYYEMYTFINYRLNSLALLIENYLKKLSYNAVALTTDVVKWDNPNLKGVIAHKTIATRAGLGFIGKSALLVTEEFGPRIRISSVLTDAPIVPDKPINESKCGSCKVCVEKCPLGAIVGNNWSLGTQREKLLDAHLCRKTCRERTFDTIGVELDVCGVCIAVCPYNNCKKQND